MCLAAAVLIEITLNMHPWRFARWEYSVAAAAASLKTARMDPVVCRVSVRNVKARNFITGTLSLGALGFIHLFVARDRQ